MNKPDYVLNRDVRNSTVLSIIGSTKFYDDMKNFALDYSNLGLTTLMTFVDKEQGEKYNTDEKILMIEGYKRISLSDVVLVVNSKGYIGDNTMREVHYAQFVKEIPVAYAVHTITEKALAGLNIYYRSKIPTKYSLISESDLSDYNLRSRYSDATSYIDKIFVRKDLKISPEIKEMSDYGIADKFTDAYRFANIYRKHMKNGRNVNVQFLDDEEFENNIRNSSIYVG